MPNHKLTAEQLQQLRIFGLTHFLPRPSRRMGTIAKSVLLQKFLLKIGASIHPKHAEALFRQWRVGKIEVRIPKNLKHSKSGY